MSRIRANTITNKAATGAPTFSNGAVVTGVCTATSFVGSGANLTGIASPILQAKYIERTAARAVAHSGNSWAEALESQFRVSITPSAVGNTIIVHLFLGYTCGNGTIGSMIPVYHDGSTAYSMIGGAGSSSYTAPGNVLASFGGLNEDLRNNSGNTQWFNAQKIGRYVTTNTNAATLPFDISTNFAAASAVPPVAIKSSIIRTSSFSFIESL